MGTDQERPKIATTELDQKSRNDNGMDYSGGGGVVVILHECPQYVLNVPSSHGWTR